MGLKDFYYSLEDKWYALMDALDDKGLPVYKLLDPIDKIVPSFALFLGLSTLVLIALIVLIFVLFFSSNTITVSFQVSSNNKPLEGVLLTIFQEKTDDFEGVDLELDSDEDGLVKTKLNPEFPVTVTASKNGFNPFEKTFDLIDEDGKKINLIELELSEQNFGPSQRTISIYDSISNLKIRKHASFEFSCVKGNAPSRKATSSGEVTVNVPKNCTKLYAVIQVEGYNSKRTLIDNRTNRVYLNPVSTSDSEPDSKTGTVFVSVEDSEGNPVENASVIIKYTLSLDEVDSGQTSESGTISFSLPSSKNYTLEVHYNSFFEEEEFFLEEDGEKNFSFTITEEDFNNNSKVFIKFVNAATQEPIPAVSAFLLRGNVPRLNDISNSDGIVLFDWGFDNSKVLATKSGYLTKLFGAELKEISDTTPQVEELTLSDETTSSTVSVQVNYSNELGGGVVEGAKVFLFDDSDNIWGFGSTTSDGLTVFEDLPPGTYKASASLESEEIFGESSEETVEAGETITLNIVLDKSLTGSLQVKVIDLINQTPIENAVVKVFEKGTNNLINSFNTNSDGLTQEIELSSGKEYDLNISAENFEDTFYTTQTIGADQTVLEEVYLTPTGFCEENPKNVLVSINSDSGEIVSNSNNVFEIEANKKYTANFVFCVPNKLYQKVVAHFMADEKNETIEQSELVFSEVESEANYKPFNTIPTGEDEEYTSSDSQDTAPFKVINYLYSDTSTNEGGTQLVKTKIKLTGNPNEHQKLYYGWFTKTSTDVDELTPKEFIEFYHTGVTPNPSYDFNIYWNNSNLLVADINMLKDESGVLKFKFANNSLETIDSGKIKIKETGHAIDLNQTEFEFTNLEVGETITFEAEVTAINYGEEIIDFNVSSISSVGEQNALYTELYSTKLHFAVNYAPEDLNSMIVTLNPTSIIEKNNHYEFNVTLKDESTSESITGASFELTQNNTALQITENESPNGVYKIIYDEETPLQASSGDLELTITKTGYWSKSKTIELIPFNPNEFESIECIKFFDEDGNPLTSEKIDLETDSSYVFTIKNECNQTVSFHANVLPTSDVLIGLNENPLDSVIAFNLNSEDSTDFYVNSKKMAGLHPVLFSFTLGSETGEKQLLFKVDPPSDALPFYLLEPETVNACIQSEDSRSDACKNIISKYEFNVSHSTDNAYVVYLNSQDFWTSTTQNNEAPWIIVLNNYREQTTPWELQESAFVDAIRQNVVNPNNRVLFESVFSKKTDAVFDASNPFKYQIVVVADYKPGESGEPTVENLNFGVFHVKFTGYSEDCFNPYLSGVEGKTGEIGLNYFDKTNHDYSWENTSNTNNDFESMFSRCSEKYCDGVQLLQVVSYWLRNLNENSFDQNNFNGNTYVSETKTVLLKKEGYFRDLILDFVNSSPSFLQPPIWFLNEISALLFEKTRFEVQNQQNLISPGKYSVNLFIHWSNSSDKGDLSKAENIIIVLKKLEDPSENNPLYFLPFDASIKNAEGKRKNYGVVLTQEELTGLTELDNLPVKENGFNGASVLNLTTVMNDSHLSKLETLNSEGKKLNLMKISKTSNNEWIAEVNLAYPSILKMTIPDNKLGKGFYSLKLLNEEFTSIDKWTALNSSFSNCTEFSGNELPENYLTHSGQEWVNKGFEAPNNNEYKGISFAKNNATGFKQGNVKLATIFFVPNEEPYPIFTPVSGANDLFEKINPLASNSKKLNPSVTLPMNNFFGDSASLTNLVKSGNACMYSGNNEFFIWWNSQELLKKHAGLTDSCIANAKNYGNSFPPSQDWGQGT